MIATVIQLERIIRDFWASAPSNSLHLETGEKAWAMPHVAIAQGDDPLFLHNKEMIGSFLWTPEEAYALAFPDAPAPANELRVIIYVLPQTPETRADQRMEKAMPTERWARSRFHGEVFNCELRLHLAETLTRAGYPSVAPERLPNFGYQQSERFGLASNWSERHAAFVAGLGTFGLSDAMITRWGKAVRFGSVVSRINLPVTKRVYGDDHHAWCLWYANGTCGACVKRCPADAITTIRGHDKQAGFNYIRETTAPYATRTYGTGATPCGLSAASNLVNSGRTIYEVAKVLGHASLKTSARYSHLSQATLLAAVDSGAAATGVNWAETGQGEKKAA